MDKTLSILSHPIFIKAGSLFILLIVVYSIVKLLQKASYRLAKDNDAKYKFKKMITFIGYLLFVLGIMLIFNTKLSGIGTALGVAGAGIAFALQEVIVSVAGYITVFTSHFYKVGDRVKLGGIKGDVIDIGILRTTLMEIGDWVNGDLYNGKMVRVANSFVFKEPVYNYSGDFPFLWDEITIPIKTNSDYKYGKELFKKILDAEVGNYADSSQVSWDKMIGNYNIENAKVQPMVTIAFDENWITYTLRYVVDYKSRRSTKNNLYSAILQGIAESNGSLEIASTAFEITTITRK